MKKLGRKDINPWRVSHTLYDWYLRTRRKIGHPIHNLNVKHLWHRYGLTSDLINEAIERVEPGIVFLPPHNPSYSVTSPILMKSKIALVGSPNTPRSGLIQLELDADIASCIRNDDQAVTGNNYCFLGNMALDGNNGARASGVGVHWVNVAGMGEPTLTVDNFDVENFVSHGFHIVFLGGRVIFNRVRSAWNNGMEFNFTNIVDSCFERLVCSGGQNTELYGDGLVQSTFSHCYFGGGAGSQVKIDLNAGHMNAFTDCSIDYGDNVNGLMRLRGSSQQNRIIGCFVGNWMGVDNTGIGIHLDGTAKDNIVSGCYIGNKWGGADTNLKYAVQIAAGATNNLVHGNNMRNVGTAAVNNLGGATNIVADNRD